MLLCISHSLASPQRKNNKNKVKKFKYHEYKPPGAAKNSADKAHSKETPHDIILQQQQLLLQLQVGRIMDYRLFLSHLIS